MLFVLQVVPSGDRRQFRPAEVPTITNSPAFAAHVMPCHTSPDTLLAVHVVPSGDVITRLVPLAAQATKRDACGDHAILSHWLSSADVREVQVVPLGEVITRLLLPSCDTATNSPFSADQQTARHWFAAAAVLAVHVTPSGEVITRFVPS